MLGCIAVKKEIDARKTTKICVGLHVGDVITLCESPYTCHYIFDSIKYIFLVHD